MTYLAALASIFISMAASAQSTTLYFSCEGSAEGLAIQMNSGNYVDGQLQGFEIRRRGLFAAGTDQIVKTEVDLNKVDYKPNNPRYKGLEKYVLDTLKDPSIVQPVFDWETGQQLVNKELSVYEVLIPPRATLTDESPFIGYVHVRYNGGDRFVVVPVNCLHRGTQSRRPA